MALSGSFKGSIYNDGYVARVEWSAEQSIESNTSTITCKLYLDVNTSLSINEYRTHKIWIDGELFEIAAPEAIRTTGTHYIGSCSKTVEHSADGVKSVSLALYFDFRANISGTYYASIEASASVVLDTIPRTSIPTLSANSVEFGDDITLYTNRASDNFTHKLYYSINGSSEVLISASVAASYTWTVPYSLMNNIANMTSTNITLRLYTYSNNSNIGNKTVSFVANVPDTIVPTISDIACYDPQGYLDVYEGFIQSKSSLRVVVDSSGSYSSTIKTCKITVSNTTYSGVDITTSTLNTAGTVDVTATVTDSRGRTATATTSITVLEYTSPTISGMTAYRCDSSGVADENGAYMRIIAQAFIKPLNHKNSKRIVVDCKKTTDTDWTIKRDTNAYVYSINVITEADSNSMYTVRLTATDDFSTVIHTVDVGTVFTLLDFNATGKGVAFGKVSESDNFDVALEAVFRQGIIGETIKTATGNDLDSLADDIALIKETLGL